MFYAVQKDTEPGYLGTGTGLEQTRAQIQNRDRQQEQAGESYVKDKLHEGQ